MADQPYPDEFNVNLPDPYLIAIGKVCVAWGVLETIVDLAIAKFAGYATFDPRSMIVTAHMTWPLKMDVIEALVTSLLPDYPQLGKFPGIKTMLKKSQDGRNRIVHGQWGYQDGSVSKLRTTARGRLRASIDPVALSDIDGIARDIGRAGAALWKLVVNK